MFIQNGQQSKCLKATYEERTAAIAKLVRYEKRRVGLVDYGQMLEGTRGRAAINLTRKSGIPVTIN